MVKQSSPEAKTPDQPDHLLTVEEVARILNVSRSFIYSLIANGELPSLHIGRHLRFRSRDVRNYIEKRAAPRP